MTVSVRIPQIGEGLQEARLVAVLKHAGDQVRRDEPIYQMETDKAVMDVESPYEGVLVRWLANPDDVLAIGAEVAEMEVEVAASAAAEASTPAPVAVSTPVENGQPGLRNQAIPPRTRAYAKEKGIGDVELATILAAGSKLMPTDIDIHLAAKGGDGTSAQYDERPVPAKQRVLISRLVRGNALVAPGTMSAVVNWEPIERLYSGYRSSGGEFRPSAFTMFAFAVAQAVKDHPALRTTLVGEDTFRTYRHLSLGIAVALPGDELVLAVIEDADTLSWRSFAARCRTKIDLARNGQDQANESVTLSLTNMQAYGLRDAVPVVVPPSVGTMFLGEAYTGIDPNTETLQPRRSANIGFSMDHRVLNGVGAAEFLKTVRSNVEGIEVLIGE